MYELIPLDCLQPGRIAEIGRLEGRPEHIKRLEELGVRRGKPVEVLRCGRTCIVRVGCHRLCLRQDERLMVLVSAAVAGAPTSPTPRPEPASPRVAVQ